jgi:6-phosphogluconolactonase (cycloisomerase 2 family)
MATEQRIGFSLSRQATLGNVLRLIPSLVILVAMLVTYSCGSSGLLDPVSDSDSPTATPTSGSATLAFVTNFNDAKVSSFTRNTTTGALKHTGQVVAGKKSGPRGLVATPNGEFLYVANVNDNNIYEFSVNANNGTLTALTPASVSNGNNTGPDELAINSTGTLLWVTNAHNGTVGSYMINTGTGQLTSVGTIGGFNVPFGITLNPSLNVLYVSDTATGLIWPMTYNTTTGALTQNFTPQHSSDPNASTPAAIAVDSGADALFIADQVLGEVSSFAVDVVTGAITPEFTFANNTTGDAPVGVALAVNTSVEFLFTANFGSSTISSFVVTSQTTVNTPPTVALGYNGAKGIVVDPQNVFVYTADSADGTVGMATINGTCGSQICAGTLVSTESPHNANSGPFGITLAQ